MITSSEMSLRCFTFDEPYKVFYKVLLKQWDPLEEVPRCEVNRKGISQRKELGMWEKNKRMCLYLLTKAHCTGERRTNV